MDRARTFVIGSAILGTIAICLAQQPSAKFTDLQRHDISGTDRVGVTTLIEIPPGVASARHSHPGEDFGYVIEGTIVLQVDGKPPQTLKAGDVFFNERGRIHNARNIGTALARAVDTYVIDKGKPTITPAP